MTLDALHARQARRARLWALVRVCVVVLAVTYLATSGVG